MSVNFYRDTYINDLNKTVVNLCKDNKVWDIFKIEFGDGRVSPLTFQHENLTVRPGMQIIRNLINASGMKYKICDIGCGLANLLKQLKTDGHDTTGIDNSPKMIINSDFPIIFAFAEKLPLDSGSFDCVIMQEVLEHVVDLEKSLMEVKRILKPGGRYFFQVPYKNNADCFGHVRHFDESKMKEVLTELKFNISDMQVIKYLDFMNLKNIFVYGYRDEN